VPAVLKFGRPDVRLVALIKPQFEVGKGQVGKGGVVKDPRLHHIVIEELTTFFNRSGLSHAPVIASPILGPKGNREFLICLRALP
jgi:23S rRNA (cytidine1920-2'-O)/16S rRNA (cytidine1409-2'-O)-methyltransferase